MIFITTTTLLSALATLSFTYGGKPAPAPVHHSFWDSTNIAKLGEYCGQTKDETITLRGIDLGKNTVDFGETCKGSINDKMSCPDLVALIKLCIEKKVKVLLEIDPVAATTPEISKDMATIIRDKFLTEGDKLLFEGVSFKGIVTAPNARDEHVRALFYASRELNVLHYFAINRNVHPGDLALPAMRDVTPSKLFVKFFAGATDPSDAAPYAGFWGYLNKSKNNRNIVVLNLEGLTERQAQTVFLWGKNFPEMGFAEMGTLGLNAYERFTEAEEAAKRNSMSDEESDSETEDELTPSAQPSIDEQITDSTPPANNIKLLTTPAPVPASSHANNYTMPMGGATGMVSNVTRTVTETHTATSCVGGLRSGGICTTEQTTAPYVVSIEFSIEVPSNCARCAPVQVCRKKCVEGECPESALAPETHTISPMTDNRGSFPEAGDKKSSERNAMDGSSPKNAIKGSSPKNSDKSDSSKKRPSRLSTSLPGALGGLMLSTSLPGALGRPPMTEDTLTRTRTSTITLGTPIKTTSPSVLTPKKKAADAVVNMPEVFEGSSSRLAIGLAYVAILLVFV